ncbi:MAG: hypothetical protein LBC68_02300 [Prevotellaceae bacterium]|jgi:hypothetical protein|nr:hypothetical protein [Prevotellaceae bacterium]
MKYRVYFIKKIFLLEFVIVLLFIFAVGVILHLIAEEYVIGNDLPPINEILDPKNKGKLFYSTPGKTHDGYKCSFSGSVFWQGNDLTIPFDDCRFYGEMFNRKCEPDRS